MNKKPLHTQVETPTEPAPLELPKQGDSRWKEVVTRPRLKHQTPLQKLPIDTDEVTLHTVYAGDLIAIVPEIRRKNYVATRVGYLVGWIDYRDLKFVEMKLKTLKIPDETKPAVPDDRDDRVRRHIKPKREWSQEDSDAITLPTRPKELTSPAKNQNKNLVGDIRRLIKHLKALVK